MFITVMYGENQQAIFNPDCRNNVLLGSIKQRCDCNAEDVVELSDEQGVVKNLHQNLLQYGTNYVHDRELLVLLRVQKPPNGEEKPKYLPLLSTKADDKEFLDRLNPRPTRGKKHHEEEKRTGSRRLSVSHTSGRRSSVNMNRRNSKLLSSSKK